MKYVKHFSINGINTTQVGCIELNGRPNAATEGAVGLLGIDVTSPTHDVYKCVAVNGSIYTWELLSSGMSVLCANITGEGGLTKTFPYSDLRIPNNYLIKVGDLILDSEGYLYQINALGNESCETAYTNVHLAGGSNGKDYKLKLTDGRLQLVTESGAVVSDVDYSNHDDITIVRDPAGKTKVVGVYTIGGSILHFFVGTQEEYDALEHKDNLFAIITDDPTPEQFRVIKETVSGLLDGTVHAEVANTLSPPVSSYTPTTVQSGMVVLNDVEPGRMYVIALKTESSNRYETITLYIPDPTKLADSTRSRNGYCCTFNPDTNGILTRGALSFRVNESGEDVKVTPAEVFVRRI